MQIRMIVIVALIVIKDDEAINFIVNNCVGFFLFHLSSAN